MCSTHCVRDTAVDTESNIIIVLYIFVNIFLFFDITLNQLQCLQTAVII